VSVLSLKTAEEIADKHITKIVKDIEFAGGATYTALAYTWVCEDLVDDVAWAIQQVELPEV
jgi:hypothetical protein